MTRDNAFFRQLLFLGVLLTLGVILFVKLYFFVGAFLGAITLYVVLRKTMFRMVEKRGMHRWVAALVLVFVMAMVLAVFGFISVLAVGDQLSDLDMDSVMSNVNSALAWFNARLGMHVIPQDILNRSDGIVEKVINGVLNTTYSFTANVVMMLFVLYFMLTSGRRMEEHVWIYSPFKGDSLNMIKREVKTMIYSNAVGMPVILALQTLASTLIYWLLDFENAWFWGFLTALCGLVPAVGTMLIYIPVSGWLIVSGHAMSGVALLFYGIVVISNVDNVLRIVLLHKVADTHPLVVIFGVILGIPLFGFWGIIFGPLFIAGTMLLVKIYYVEYGLLDYREYKTTPLRKTVPRHFKGIHKKMCKGAVGD